jgi:hypothetical protein
MVKLSVLSYELPVMQDYHQLEIWQRAMAYTADLWHLKTDN